MEKLIKESFKRAIVEGGLQLFNQGLTVGTWGNLSIRDRETGYIYIKPSGMPYPDITADDVVVMDRDFHVVEGHRKPSIEYHLHISIMNARDDVNAIIHTHPIYSSVFGVLREEIPGISEDFVQIVGDKVICCEYALPGTPQLAKNLVAALGNRNAVMVPNHGTVCVGASWADAMKIVYVVEKTAQIYQLARSIGTPKLIDPDDIKAMQDFARNFYGQDK